MTKDQNVILYITFLLTIVNTIWIFAILVRRK